MPASTSNAPKPGKKLLRLHLQPPIVKDWKNPTPEEVKALEEYQDNERRIAQFKKSH
jgi:hypothetical protein